MSTDEPESPDEPEDESEKTSPQEKLEEGADKAVEQLDKRVIDLLSWLLDTETRAKIYIYLHQTPASTSDEVAKGTGLYPSTVREALASLHEEGVVTREKRESDGAGNNPYEYEAIPPSELVNSLVSQVQSELNALFNLEEYMSDLETDTDETESEPVTISVNEPGEDDE